MVWFLENGGGRKLCFICKLAMCASRDSKIEENLQQKSFLIYRSTQELALLDCSIISVEM